MKLRLGTKGLAAFSLVALAGLCTASAWAANDPEYGNSVVGEAALEVEPVELLDAAALQTLVAPVALYPDDLLAVVLPASTYPLQVVLAARFLEEDQESANRDAVQPSEEWDDAVVALLNYPEVVALMDNNLDWTRRLGEAVIVQEEDVIAAISAFREQAKDAGNLESDGKQEVAVNEAGAIEIKPAVPDEIYVPYYEPEQVVVRQPTRVYHYYPRPYPVYYYPYHQGYDFAYGPFWGVTSAFSIGWRTRNLHLHHYGFNDHPYYSYRYYDPFYYRRPHLVLNIYDRDRRHRHRHRSDRHHRGNDWRSERSKRDHRRWAARDDRRRGEGRRDDRRRDDQRRGDRQRRAERQQGESIARTLKTGANPTVHLPTQITPLGEVPPRPTANRSGAAGAQASGAGADRATVVTPFGEVPIPANVNRSGTTSAQAAGTPAAEPSNVGRTERQRPARWRAERRGENARLPQSRSQAATPTATNPVQRPNRAQITRQAQRTARPAQPAANQPRVNANIPFQVRQAQRAQRHAPERVAPRAQARPQPQRARTDRAPQRVERAPQRTQRAAPPRTQRPQAIGRQSERQAVRQAARQARSQPSLNRAPPARVQRPSAASRQAVRQAVPRAVQQTRSQPRLNRQAPARSQRPAAPVRPAQPERRVERSAPQRPVRSRPMPSGDDYRSRRPR